MTTEKGPAWPDLAQLRVDLQEREASASDLKPQWRHELQLELADLEYLTGEIKSAQDLFELVKAESQRPDQIVTAMLGLARIEYTRSQWDESEDLVRHALEQSSKNGIEADLLALRAMLRYRRGRYDACIRDAEAVIEMKPDSFAAGLAHSSLGIVHSAQQNDAEALNHWKRALELAKILKSPELAVRVYNNKGTYHYDRKKYEKAHNNFKQAIEIAQDTHFEVYLGFPLANLAGNYLVTENPEASKEALLQARELFMKVGNVMMQGAVNMELGQMYRLSRDLDRAQNHLDNALNLNRECGAHRFLIFTYRELGLLHRDQKLWVDAIMDFKLAMEFAVIQKDHFLQVEISRYLNECLENRDTKP